ncbi:MAG TPA: hypothetical protein VFX89_08975 [Gammaproteobacteria bacterium]|nr:hypothetical protein [Gammaproteobacteria bacterium]
MKSALLFCALLLPCLGFSATLTGTITSSTSAVDLATVGTVDWARWPGYKHKAGSISNISVTGTLISYTNDPRKIGDYSGVKLVGVGSQFVFTVPAATTQRTLLVYLGGWNSTGTITVTLPGAPTYTVTTQSSSSYSRVVTLKYSSAVAATLRFQFKQTGDGGSGSIKLQAAALQGAPAPASGSALLTWTPPTKYTDGTTMTDLAGYKVYWGTTQGIYSNSAQINSGGVSSYTVKGLAAGRWYFMVTSLGATGVESPPSPVLSKVIQ